MTNGRFDELQEHMLNGRATREEMREFLLVARGLRACYIAHIDESDSWDEDHPLVSYVYNDRNAGNTSGELRVWADTV